GVLRASRDTRKAHARSTRVRKLDRVHATLRRHRIDGELALRACRHDEHGQRETPDDRDRSMAVLRGARRRRQLLYEYAVRSFGRGGRAFDADPHDALAARGQLELPWKDDEILRGVLIHVVALRVLGPLADRDLE